MGATTEQRERRRNRIFSKDVAQASLIGLIGVVLGICISLLPTYLNNMQIEYEQAGNRCRAIDFEIRENIAACKDIINTLNLLSSSKNMTSRTLISSSLYRSIWQSSIADGQFIVLMPMDDLLKIRKTYDDADTLNEVLRHYLLLRATDQSLNSKPGILFEYHNQLKVLSQTTSEEYSNILEYLPKNTNKFQNKVDSYYLWSKCLGWGGLLMVVATFFILVCDLFIGFKW